MNRMNLILMLALLSFSMIYGNRQYEDYYDGDNIRHKYGGYRGIYRDFGHDNDRSIYPGKYSGNSGRYMRPVQRRRGVENYQFPETWRG